MTPSRDISRLIEIMAALRTPVTGCPWDLEQTFETIAPYTIEEAYEVADAIQSGSRAELCEELFDLLEGTGFEVVRHLTRPVHGLTELDAAWWAATDDDGHGEYRAGQAPRRRCRHRLQEAGLREGPVRL